MILLHIFYGEFFDEKSMPESAKNNEISFAKIWYFADKVIYYTVVKIDL